MKSKYDNYTEKDWNKLNGLDWYRLLIEQPQFEKFKQEVGE